MIQPLVRNVIAEDGFSLIYLNGVFQSCGIEPETPLYARVDLVRADNGPGFVLMELELIEPSLYLRCDRQAAARFAAAIAAG